MRLVQQGKKFAVLSTHPDKRELIPTTLPFWSGSKKKTHRIASSFRPINLTRVAYDFDTGFGLNIVSAS